MASVLNLLDPNARVKTLQLSCRFKRNDGTSVPNDEENRDANCAYQLVIFGVGRRQNVKRIHPGLQSRLG